jgi:GR25 family glycosyltransferase involved in LPS biosynthesis
MKHYWINLNKCSERKTFMENQFNKLNINNVRVSAITPDDFDNILEQKRPLTCKFKGCDSCEYEFACISSHIKALRCAIEDCNDEWFVIMEDDMTIPFNIDYHSLIKDAPEDSEIIQLHILYGSTVKTLYNELLLKKNIRFIKWQYLLPSAGMYIISRKGAEKLINKFYVNDKYDFSSCEYQIVADVALYSTINTYATTIPYAYPNIDMGSTIHPDHLKAHQLAIYDIKYVINDALSKNAIPYIY